MESAGVDCKGDTQGLFPASPGSLLCSGRAALGKVKD